MSSRTGLHIQEHDNVSPSLPDSLDGLCHLTALQELSIEGNQESLPSNFSSLINLRYLRISFQNLKELPPTLHTCNVPKLSKLHYLSLDGCKKLSELPRWIGSLSQLSVLDVSEGESLTCLPNLHKLQNLKRLQLFDCIRLQQLPQAFASRGCFPSLKVSPY